MEFNFHAIVVEAIDGEKWLISSAFHSSIPTVAVMYRNGEYRERIYSSRVQYDDSIEDHSLIVHSSRRESYFDWDGSRVTMQLLPEYYFYPWRSVIVCVEDQVMTYSVTISDED